MAEELNNLGFEEIEELDAIAQGSIPNRLELVSITSKWADTPITICRDQVYKYASVMSNNNLISELLGIDTGTLVKYFKRELTMGRAFARQKLATRFYHLALYGTNPADRIFALKNWTAMSDQGLKEELEDAEAGAEFKIRRPKRVIEFPSDIEQRNNQFDEYDSRVVKIDPALTELPENETD